MFQLLPLLQAAGKSGGMGGSTMTLVMILGIILVFYFFMIRPQQKKQKQVEQFRNSLQKGDKVITIGGIHGKITEVHEDYFTIEIANDINIQIEKNAVAIDDQQLKEQSKKAKEEKK